MGSVTVTLPNTLENQEWCRQVRNLHKQKGQPLTVRFDEDLSHIILEAACLFLPSKEGLSRASAISGCVKKMAGHYEVHPREKGKTINLRLDSELAAELEEIRRRVEAKTQHSVALDMFIRGLRAFRQEQAQASGQNQTVAPGAEPAAEQRPSPGSG